MLVVHLIIAVVHLVRLVTRRLMFAIHRLLVHVEVGQTEHVVQVAALQIKGSRQGLARPVDARLLTD